MLSNVYIKKTLSLLTSIIAFWIVGLLLFVYAIPETSELKVKSVDAIVILTGGTMRLEEGLELFDKVNAGKILISGVGKGFSKSDIASLIKDGSKLQVDDVILGELAETTYSNGVEADIFMTLHGFKSMLLVTSNYHILRSKAVFTAMMPEFNIAYYPVCSDNFKKTTSFISWPSLKVAISEYNKYIAFYAVSFYERLIIESDLLFYPLYAFLEKKLNE